VEEEAVAERQRWWRRDSNPVLIKELRGRMRGARAFVVLTVYLLILSCFVAIVYYAYSASGPGIGSTMAYLGKVVFASVVLIELFMVVFITPAFTTGAISGERERMTYELLRTTLLPARALVFGKLASALTYVLLLILAAVPLEAMAFMLGGVIVEELGLALVILLVTAFFFAAAGLFFSSIVRTTLASTVLTYATALLATVGLPLLVVIFAAVATSPAVYGYGLSVEPWVLEAVLAYGGIVLTGLSPITAAVRTEEFLLEQNALLYYWQDLDYVYSGGKSLSHRILVPSPWIVYTVIYVGLGLVLALMSVQRVRRQARR
jgi:ABC-type transport system involved in multi-copper enzyme maturation permease subunit